MTAGVFDRLHAMNEDHLQSPGIYHASKFWEKLNRLNIEWIESDGIENFKRTVNNNYFNWMVSARSVYLRNMVRSHMRRHRGNPAGFIRPLFAAAPQMHFRTYVSQQRTVPGYWQRKLYGIYTALLADFVAAQDPFGLFRVLDEPAAGNPITLISEGRSVSQDLCNSYLEYQFIREALGDQFSGVMNIVEIGSGYGRLAYVFRKLAQTGAGARKYILVDLPVALSVAQWYLSQAFPDARIFGYRKFDDFSAVESQFANADFCFILPHQLALLPQNYVDLAINISSFQEMSADQINAYYELIDAKARHFYTKQWMFWENPEDGTVVPAVVYPTRPHWRLMKGRLNPVHSDFFEALFSTTGRTKHLSAGTAAEDRPLQPPAHAG